MGNPLERMLFCGYRHCGRSRGPPRLLRPQTYGGDGWVDNDNGLAQTAIVMDLCPVIYLAGQSDTGA